MFTKQKTALPQNKFTILTTLFKFCWEETSELGTLLAWLGKAHPWYCREATGTLCER